MNRICPTCGFEDPDHDKVFCPKDATVLSLAPGTVLLKKYRIVSEIARGGMAVIYRARHLHYDEDMALKILNEQHGREFVAEARLLRRLHHPNIVRVEDADFLDDGRPFLAMEFIEGEDLASRMRRLPVLPPREALHIAAQICAGLAAAHDAGMIHRDINPKNILLMPEPDGSETVKLIDFGIAKVRKDTGIGFTGVQRGTTGFFLGTPRYASPEQALLKPLDVRTDLYSTGLVLYEMLTGRLPSAGETDEAILHHRRYAEPAPPDRIRPDLPAGVSGIVMRALELDPAARYQTAQQMQAACESALRAIDRPRRNWRRAVPTGPGWSLGKWAAGFALFAAGFAGVMLLASRAGRQQVEAPPPVALPAQVAAPKQTTPRPAPSPLPDIVQEPKPSPMPVRAKARPATPKVQNSASRSAEPAPGESVQQVLDRWIATTRSGNIAGRLSLYGDQVGTFYLKHNLNRAELANELRDAYSRYPGFTSMRLTNLTWEPLRPGLVEAQFDKEFTATRRDGGSYEGKVHSQLTMQQTAAGWKIVDEKDSKVYWTRQTP